MKVLVKSPFSPYSGYGNDGIGLVEALLRAGVDVYLDPIAVAPPLPRTITDLLIKRLVAPFDLLIQHTDPAMLGITKPARRAATATMAWTMWEYTSFANLRGRSTLRNRLKDFDLVVGYDTVTSDCLTPYAPGRVATVQGGFDPKLWPTVTRDWTGDRFGFCMVGQLHQRKDPFVAIQAFKELKDEHPEEFEPAELHLKTNVPGLHPAMQEWVPKLRVHYDVWPTDVLREFYGNQHCLLAPSRGEGKNVPALEFMSTGGAVIATNWGGHTQWLSSNHAYPLDYTLVPVNPNLPDCCNARAKKDHLKDLMLHVFRNRSDARDRGARAAALIPTMCSWDAVVQRLFDRLRATVPGGDRLAHDLGAGKARGREPVGV